MEKDVTPARLNIDTRCPVPVLPRRAGREWFSCFRMGKTFRMDNQSLSRSSLGMTVKGKWHRLNLTGKRSNTSGPDAAYCLKGTNSRAHPAGPLNTPLLRRWPAARICATARIVFNGGNKGGPADTPCQ